MKKTFTEQLLLNNNVDYISRPIEPMNTLKEQPQPGQQPAGQLPQPAQQKPMGQQTTDKFVRSMAPSGGLTPEATVAKPNQPGQNQQMSFLERMRINSKLKGAFGNGSNT